LRFRGRIVGLIAFHESGEWEIKVFGAVGASGVRVSIQHKGLRHMTEGGFRSLSLDLRAPAVVTAPDPCSKTKEELLLNGFGRVGKVGIAPGVATEFEPQVPVFGLKAVVHCCSGNRLPSSVEVTSKICFGIRCTSRQY
jgi:hypothetical protein